MTVQLLTNASDAVWLIASKRASALEALLAGSTTATVAEVAHDLNLSTATVYRLLALSSQPIDKRSSTKGWVSE
jgi:hypothetical protein